MVRPYTLLDDEECERLGGRPTDDLCLVEIAGETLNVHEVDIVDPINDISHLHINLAGSRDAVTSKETREWALQLAKSRGRGHSERDRSDKNFPVNKDRSDYPYTRSFNYY